MAAAGARSRPPIAILTDFGSRDHYAGVMRGVIASIAPAANVIDITHGIPPQSIIAGALALRESWRFFPQRTIFVAVVDPGVGTARLPIAVATRAGARFIGPDNGLLWPAVEQAAMTRAVHLRAPRYRLSPVGATFHGRDIFAPAAAWLWRGTALAALGPALMHPVRLELGPKPEERGRALRGIVIHVDSFGNLITNISRACFEQFAARFRDCWLSVKIKRHSPISMRQTYGDVRAGVSLAIFGSYGMLEVAVRDGNASDFFAAGAGTSVTIKAQD
jgi:hypothetical protein